MKKLFSIILITLLCTSIYAQNINLSTEDIDPELLEFVDDLNSQDYLAEAEAINNIVIKISTIKPSSQVIDFSVYTKRMTPTDTQEFLSLPLSEKLKVYRDNSKIEREMIEAFMSVAPSTKNSPEYIEQANLIKDLLNHASRLMEITSNIISSSNDYVGAAIDNLTEAQTYIEDAKVKMALLTTQISFLNEALAYQEAKNKRAYIAGNIIIPVVGVTGLIPSIIMMANGDERGYDLMMADLGITLSCSLIWNGGHLIFKWW